MAKMNDRKRLGNKQILFPSRTKFKIKNTQSWVYPADENNNPIGTKGFDLCAWHAGIQMHVGVTAALLFLLDDTGKILSAEGFFEFKKEGDIIYGIKGTRKEKVYCLKTKRRL